MKKLIFVIVAICLIAGFAVDDASAQLATTQKASTLSTMRNLAMDLCATRRAVDEIAAKWAALGYASGGSNPFTQLDIDAIAEYEGLPLADIQAIIAAFGGFRTNMDTWDDEFRKIMN